MRNPEFVRKYDALAPEFAVAGQPDPRAERKRE